MCAIAGAMVFSASDFKISESYLERMRDTMAHRGPDGAGLWLDGAGRVGLAHRRLAIIDLSPAAAQPMTNEDGSLRIVFNGEIYNHRALRAELEAAGGHRFATDHADTEVILHAFEEWGIDCVHRLRGMFAFALWDAGRHELWLVRDRIGVKPLYYNVCRGRLAFASEIKALLTDPEQRRSVDEESLFHYLSFLTTPAPRTLFESICKLPAGTWMRVHRDGRVQQRHYWDVYDHLEDLTGATEAEIASRLLTELRTSVALRKESDVPVGVFLSGGIDSSTNARLFSETNGHPVRTFSIGYDADYGSYPNETAHAARVAATVGAEHHERLLGLDDLIEFVPRMVELQDEPIADPVCVPLYYVSKLAREHGVTVCQVGEGSDELFGGYPGWIGLRRLQRLVDAVGVAGLRGMLFGRLMQVAVRRPFAGERLRRAAAGQPVFWGGAEAFPEPHKRRLLSPRLRARYAGLSSWDVLKPLRDRFEAASARADPLDWMTYVDLKTRLPELLLMRVDKMSMGVSVECRVPFLDHEFVTLAASVPASLKIRRGVLKHILKKSVAGLLPAEVINRPKQGFGLPLQDWFVQRLRPRIRREVDDFCAATDLLDADEARRCIDGDDANQAWYLFNLALWWKQAIGQQRPLAD